MVWLVIQNFRQPMLLCPTKTNTILSWHKPSAFSQHWQVSWALLQNLLCFFSCRWLQLALHSWFLHCLCLPLFAIETLAACPSDRQYSQILFRFDLKLLLTSIFYFIIIDCLILDSCLYYKVLYNQSSKLKFKIH